MCFSQTSMPKTNLLFFPFSSLSSWPRQKLKSFHLWSSLPSSATSSHPLTESLFYLLNIFLYPLTLLHPYSLYVINTFAKLSQHCPWMIKCSSLKQPLPGFWLYVYIYTHCYVIIILLFISIPQTVFQGTQVLVRYCLLYDRGFHGHVWKIISSWRFII